MKAFLIAILITVGFCLDMQQYSRGFSSQLGLNPQQVADGQECFSTGEVLMTEFKNNVRSSLGTVEASTTGDWVQNIKFALMETCPDYEKDVKRYLIANTKVADIKGILCVNMQTYNTQIQQKLTAWASALDNHNYSGAGAIQADLYKIIFGLINPATDPTAAFTVSINGRAASFDGTSSSDPDGNVVSYSWSFDEPSSTSNTATTGTASHVYATGGTYLVSLTVTDNSGNTATSSRSIQVSGVNSIPTAAFTFTNRYLAVSFDASGSTDFDGTIATYAWNFGESRSSANTASGATASHTFAASGTYRVTLTVTDNEGGINVLSQDVVVVANVPPTASFTYTATNYAVAFDARTSTGSDGAITNYAWNFGEASSSSNTASGATTTASHTYSTAGTYTVTLTLTDNLGATTTTSKTFIVNTPPTAAFTYTPTYLAVSFDARRSADSDGTISTYTWNFGESGSSSNTANETTDIAAHTYAAAGTYTVTLTITDNLGTTTTTSQNVTVAANVAPTPGFIYSPAGLNVSFNSRGSTDSDGTITTYAWDFGESSSSSNNASGSTTSHIYAAAGTYIATLTVTDDAGATRSISRSVVVGAGSVTASFTSSIAYTTVSFSGTATDSTGGTITSYAWDFGEPSGSNNTATGARVTHNYAGIGTYTVTLTVINSFGIAATTTRNVTITTTLPAGKLQIAVIWDLFGDPDLVVTTPSGKNVYYNNRGPNVGSDYGKYEIDSHDFGPEYVYWAPSYTPPIGIYHICLQLYNIPSQNSYSYYPGISASNPLQVQTIVAENSVVKFSTTKTVTNSGDYSGVCSPSSDSYLASYTYNG